MAWIQVSVHASRPTDTAGRLSVEVPDGYLEIASTFDVLNEALETLYHRAIPDNREAVLRGENPRAGPKTRDDKGDLIDRVEIPRTGRG